MQQKLGITFVYITHDQEEALNMSSRIVILRRRAVSSRSARRRRSTNIRSTTVRRADFIGQNNLLPATVTSVTPESGLTLCDVDGVSLPALPNDRVSPAVGERAALCLRPQRVRYGSEPQHRMALKGIIRSKEYVGGMQHTQIALSDALRLNAVTQSAELDSCPDRRPGVRGLESDRTRRWCPTNSSIRKPPRRDEGCNRTGPALRPGC